jgi:hypothetical protein
MYPIRKKSVPRAYPIWKIVYPIRDLHSWQPCVERLLRNFLCIPTKKRLSLISGTFLEYSQECPRKNVPQEMALDIWYTENKNVLFET